jgi:hypothetical protein
VWLKIRPTAPAPVPVAEPTDSPLEAEAKRLIASGEVTVQSVQNMSSHELEMRARSEAFCLALELLPKPAPETRTRGDIVIAEGRKNHASKNGIVLDYDAVAAVEASRRAVAEGYANYQPSPSRPAVDPHMNNAMARRKAFTSAELKQFERENAARSSEPTQSRADAIREAQLAEAKVKAARWSR